MNTEIPENAAQSRSEAGIGVLVEIEVAQLPGRDADSAIEFLQRFESSRFRVDTQYPPGDLVRRSGQFRGQTVGPTVILRGAVADSAKIDELRRRPEILEVWLDSPVYPYSPPFVCGNTATADYDIQNVITELGVDQIWQDGFRGKDVAVGVVDLGVDRNHPNMKNGWPPNKWGDGSEHGNMVACDITKIAPEVNLFDLKISSSVWPAYLRDAYAAIDWVVKAGPKASAEVLVCCWGLPTSVMDRKYAHDKEHCFTQRVLNAIDAGFIVVFAAGNCGGQCPYSCCGDKSDPAGPIWGANGLEEVMTVGAANLSGQYFGNSSYGPASLATCKPDFCAPSYFAGGFHQVDAGTSAAAAILAGLVALLRQAHPTASQWDIKESLIRTARDIHLPGFDYRSGYGTVQGYDALSALNQRMSFFVKAGRSSRPKSVRQGTVGSAGSGG